MRIVVKDKKYWIPMKQSEITWGVGKAIDEIVERHQCECKPEAQIEIVAAMAGCDPEIMKEVAPESLSLIVDTHKFFHSKDIEIPFYKFIKYKRKMYKFNIEYFTSRRYMKTDLMMIEEELEDLFFELFEPIPWYNLRGFYARLFCKNRISIDAFNYYQVKMALYLHIQKKTEVLKAYGLVGDELPADQVDEGPVTLSTIEKFGLYHVILQTCENDIRLMDYWLDRDVRELFKYVAYLNIKAASTKKD